MIADNPDWFAWWRQALKDQKNGVFREVPNVPECGFYQRRLVRDGVFVPCRIFMVRDVDIETLKPLADPVMICEIDWWRRDPHEQWSWISGNPISEEEWKYLRSMREYARDKPGHPYHNPRVPVDPVKAALLVKFRPETKGENANDA